MRLIVAAAIIGATEGFGIQDVKSLLWHPDTGVGSGVEPVTRGRNLQDSSKCVRNCEKGTCNYTETRQMKKCVNTCGCGAAGRWPKLSKWPEAEVHTLGDNWAPKCNLGGKTSTVEIYKGACKANRMIVSGLQYNPANGDYRSGGHYYDKTTPSYCNIPDPKVKYSDGTDSVGGIPGTVLKLWGVDYDMYLYFGEPKGEGAGWFISDKPCEFYTFLARIDAEEGAKISGLFDDASFLKKAPLKGWPKPPVEFHTMMMSRMLQFVDCQHGFEGKCGWRECIEKSKSGHPRCRVSNVPNRDYGFIRMPYNRAVFIRDPAYVPAIAYRNCLGDFNQNEKVEVQELMEVLAAFGVSSCSVRADVDRDCKVGVHDVLTTLGHFGKCDTSKKNIPAYQRTKLMLSGFTSPRANGVYELQNSSFIPACKATTRKEISPSKKSIQVPERPLYKRIASKGEKGGEMYLFGSSPGESYKRGKTSFGNSKLFGPNLAQSEVKRSRKAGLKWEEGEGGKDPRRWYLGETPCRDDVAYAYMDSADYKLNQNGQVNVLSVKDTPCPNEKAKNALWTKPCVWQECSKAQYGYASCRMYCPPGKNCPALRAQDHVQVIPDGSSEGANRR